MELSRQGQMKQGRVTKNSSTQTDCRSEGEPEGGLRKELLAQNVNTANGAFLRIL